MHPSRTSLPEEGGWPYIDSDGVARIAIPLEVIAEVLSEWWSATKKYREDKTEEVQEETLERLRNLTSPEFVATILEAYEKRKKEAAPRRSGGT